MSGSVRRARAIAAIAIVALAAAGWFVWRLLPGRIVPGSCGGCNVLLITIDTLRSDRVGAFGGTGRLTPALDRLAAGALRFTRAYASAPLTLPSHASIMTAVSPPVHGVRNNSLFRVGEALPTLTTVLKSAGYRTWSVRRRLRPRRALRPESRVRCLRRPLRRTGGRGSGGRGRKTRGRRHPARDRLDSRLPAHSPQFPAPTARPLVRLGPSI